MKQETLDGLLKNDGANFFWANGISEPGQSLDTIPKILIIIDGVPHYCFSYKDTVFYKLEGTGSIRLIEKVNGEYKQTDKVFNLDG